MGKTLKWKQKWVIQGPVRRLPQWSRKDMMRTLAKSVRAQGIEHLSKVLLGHPVWGHLLDGRLPACLLSCRLVTGLLVSCSTANTHSSILDSLFPTRPMPSESIFTASPYPHPWPSHCEHVFLSSRYSPLIWTIKFQNKKKSPDKGH